jgi:metallo-beta-lactamase family protein
MKIHFNGAAQTVTGSQYLLEINGYKLLLECGLYQGRRAESTEKNRNFQFDVSTLDAMILSHAHIDHCGNLPNLIRNGYTGPIYATSATKDLADLLVRDSAHIQEADAEYINKKNARKGLPPVEPLYTISDAARVNQYILPVEYGVEFDVIPGVKARLVDAGHILGSAAVVLDINEQGKKTKLWFSGDIGRPGLPLVRDPVQPEDGIDLMMMECTYGDKSHENPEKAFEELKTVILRTYARRGKIIIPAFAVGRTQELVYALNDLMTHNAIPKIPVFVDSPLAVSSSEIFSRHPECFDAETRLFVKDHMHPALDFDMLTYIQSVEESKALNERRDPMIIISASGMAEVGRILHHLKNNIEDPRNTILIVSWQAPYTLGRRIADREPVVKIFGEEYQLKAEVATIGGLSSHAGQDLLVKYAARVKGQAKQIILIHGEPDASTALQAKFKELDFPPVTYPALYDQYEA